MVDKHGPCGVNAAAEARAGGPSGARRAANGLVGRDVGVADCGRWRTSSIEEAAAQAVAAVASCSAGAAGGLVGADGAVAQHQARVGAGEAIDAAVEDP